MFKDNYINSLSVENKVVEIENLDPAVKDNRPLVVPVGASNSIGEPFKYKDAKWIDVNKETQ